MTWTLVIIGLCLLGEGFFSGSEIALVSANRLQLKVWAEEGHRGATLALQLLERPEFLLGTCLIGTNVCTVGASTVAAVAFAHQLGNQGEFWVALSLFPLILLFGELIPKSVYREHADTLVTRIIYPLKAVSVVLTPLLHILETTTRTVIGLGGLDSSTEGSTSREDLQRMIDESETIDIDEDDYEVFLADPEAFLVQKMQQTLQVAQLSTQHNLLKQIEVTLKILQVMLQLIH